MRGCARGHANALPPHHPPDTGNNRTTNRIVIVRRGRDDPNSSRRLNVPFRFFRSGQCQTSFPGFPSSRSCRRIRIPALFRRGPSRLPGSWPRDARNLGGGFHQHWGGVMPPVPVARQSAPHHREDVRGQVRDVYPGQNEEAGIVDHAIQVPLPGGSRPVDEGFAGRGLPSRSRETEHGHGPPVAIRHRVAHLGANQGLVAESPASSASKALKMCWGFDVSANTGDFPHFTRAWTANPASTREDGVSRHVRTSPVRRKRHQAQNHSPWGFVQGRRDLTSRGKKRRVGEIRKTIASNPRTAKKLNGIVLDDTAFRIDDA